MQVYEPVTWDNGFRFVGKLHGNGSIVIRAFPGLALQTVMELSQMQGVAVALYLPCRLRTRMDTGFGLNWPQPVATLYATLSRAVALLPSLFAARISSLKRVTVMLSSLAIAFATPVAPGASFRRRASFAATPF